MNFKTFITILFGLELANKRFGLVEAEAAMRFVTDKAQIAPVLAVVCGVLGYENAVAADVAAANIELEQRVVSLQAGVDLRNDVIQKASEEIEDLKGGIRAANERNASLAEVRDLFRIAS